ncbi:MAG: chromosome segregation protein SMC [Deltaproteobacteria bacterium]|nr:chromosome segregation protein SMC [Deltaproteobacteria bacterium]
MRIKQLQITGFKSFVDKTVFEFDEGITGVVGPNGCGKSNVVDAMRWAMGEQSPRHLRGKSMEDVIFAGSEAKAPVSMAEVAIQFDNSDGTAPPAFAQFTEIEVCRRLYRTGESEYLLNRAPARLRDVLDFFRDTGIGTRGYTIVEQNQITAFTSAKPDDRRVLIEQAAGISKYKARRREAERKMESTDQNLLRVSDVLGEIRRQINSIERQAKKAARYKRLREVVRTLELSLARDEREDLLGEMSETGRKLAGLRDAATALETRLSESELGLEQRRLGLAERERILNQGAEALYSVRSEIKQLESHIEFETRERETLARTGEARGEELVELAEQETGLGDAEARQVQGLAQIEEGLATEAEAMAAAETQAGEAQETLRNLEADRERMSSEMVELLTNIARSEDRRAAVEDRRAEIQQRMRSADEQLEVQQGEASRATETQSELEEGLRNLLAERDQLMGRLREALDGQGATQEAVRTASAAFQQARSHRETRHARLASLREMIDRQEDVADGTRHLLEGGDGARSAHGLRGMVRDVLEAGRDVELAVEAVLADRAEALIATQATGALSALEAIRGAGAGRGVFVVEPASEAVETGMVPLGLPLLDYVQVREGYEAVARQLLGGVQLVDDLGEAVRVYGQGRIPATFVTRQGDVLGPDGVLRGGSEASGTGLLARVREVRELEMELKALDAEMARQGEAHSEAEAAAARGTDEVENLRNRHHTAALAVANHEKDLERTRERVKSISEVHAGRVEERARLLGETENLEGEGQRLGLTITDTAVTKADMQRGLDELNLQIGSAGREAARREQTVTERRVVHGSRVEKRDELVESLARTRAALSEARGWIARRHEEIESGEARRTELATSLEEARSGLAAKLEEEERSRASNDEKRNAYEQDATTLREMEEGVRGLRGELQAARDALQAAELGAREAELKLQHLEESIRDRWNVDIATWQPTELELPAEPEPVAAATDEGGESAPTEGEATESELALDARSQREIADVLLLSREGRQERLVEARGKLESLGEVNLGAIEEHEELRERFDFLTEQKDDLERTMASLREAISKINRSSRKRFRETFDAVNERFQVLFPRLFRGGKAHLALTDAEDVLEAGIDIVAQPPGKRLQNVGLLSGGEKTLTSLALLVALFQVRPSPFFLLDEVDAALDDANVGRFNEIVKEMSEDSQFLVITHNKRTIEICDVLYGVTMENRGVSTLVSVELH